ncbi:DUF4232 domain-containing protein [Streptomyces fagopyri]|uniref:DUF4232 domain-containing protein n=1 Tax=Streptomyces fagopyri TaxID=2662397 RepID=UPI0037F93CC3
MSGNRRTAFLVSAVLVGGAMLMTACQDSDTGAGQSSSSGTTAGKADTPSGSSATGGGQGGGSDSTGTDATGTDATGTDATGTDATGKGSGGKSSGGQGTAAGTGSSGNGEAGKPGKCRTDELEITAADNTIAGDPDGTVTVRLKNGGGRDCAISGYAGVDLKTGAGSLSAKRTGQQATSVILRSGRSVAFGINYPVNRSGGSGVRVTGLLVTPPDETKTVTLGWPGAATLPVTDGAGSPVKVGPVGGAGQGG